MKEEVFLRDVKKTRRRWKIDLKIDLEDQRWIHYSVFASFVIMILMNYAYPGMIEKPTYQIKTGFLGFILTTIGAIFLFSGLVHTPYGFINELVIISIAIVFLYFGLPLLIQW